MQITIGTSPKTGLNLTDDVRLVRGAILFCDEVVLCSPAYSLLLPMLKMGNLKLDDQLDFLEKVIPYSDLTDEQKEFAIQAVRGERRSLKQGSVVERLWNRAILKRRFGKKWAQLKETYQEVNQDTAFKEFSSAIKSGLLRVHEFQTLKSAEIETKGFYTDLTNTSAKLVKEFIQLVGESISNGSTYPLFDNETNTEIKSRIDLGTIRVSDLDVNRIKHVALGGDLVQKLPRLDEVPIDEIIDIRFELEESLVRFRSALIKYAEEIKSAPWEGGFEIEADQLFRKYVGPAIQDIADEIRQRSSIGGLVAERLTSPVLASGGILVALDTLLALPAHAVITIGGFAAGTGILHSAYKEWQKEGLQIKKNQLYFYYELHNRLS